MFYVYLLRSEKDKRYYMGYAEDVAKRLGEHNSGKVTSTKLRKPFKLIGYEAYNSSSEARWREREIKRSAYKRYKFIDYCKNCRPSSIGRAILS